MKHGDDVAEGLSDGWTSIGNKTKISEIGNLSGIYKFTIDRVPYVGQSVDIARRLAEHGRGLNAKLAGDVQILFKEVAGNKLAREIAEFKEIRRITGGLAAKLAHRAGIIANKVDPLGKARQLENGL